MRKLDYIQFIVIDLFCGAGGTTLGFEEAESNYDDIHRLLLSFGITAPESREDFFRISKVVACVNHDHLAIKSHWSNHPDVEHFEEDIRILDPYGRLRRLVEIYRAFYPAAKIILWASLECTNFSKAKGGLPRDADSRTLAEHLYKYIDALDPDYIKIENVVEFMAWGPLDENGKPLSKRSGSDWLRWRKSICDRGYRDEWRELNSADFGATQSRNRLFGCFSKRELPLVWPIPTHAKEPEKTSMFGQLKKHEAVKQHLDFSDEGRSIFNRKKPMSPKSIQRFYLGCIKHVAGGKNAFLSLYYSGKPETRSTDLDLPSPSITCVPHEAVVFITKAYSSNSGKSVNAGSSIEKPCPTVAVRSTLGVGHVTFLSRYNGVNGGKHDNSFSVEAPIGALGCGDNQSKISCYFIAKYYTQGGQFSSIEDPCSTLPTKDRMTLVKADKFILNPSWGQGHSAGVDAPCPVVIARQDKAPLYLIVCKKGPIAVPVYEGDCEWTIRLKKFMALYGIADIKMRMLKVSELKKIQGFPEDYILLGNQADQKKFIGNAVHPLVPKFWIKALSKRLAA